MNMPNWDVDRRVNDGASEHNSFRIIGVMRDATYHISFASLFPFLPSVGSSLVERHTLLTAS